MKLETNKNNLLGDNIKKLRKLNNISQEELALKLFISRTAISKWESGSTEPNIEFLRKMASIFNVDLNELIKYENTEYKKEPIKEKQIIKESIKSVKSKFIFNKSYYSDLPKVARDEKLFKSLVASYAISIMLLLAGFYLTIIVLIIWGRVPDTSNIYIFQVIAGIPLMCLGIVLITITLKKHLLFDLVKRKQMFNSKVMVDGNEIKVMAENKSFQLSKKDIESVKTYYEKLPSSIWKIRDVSPLVVEIKFSNLKTLRFYELRGFAKIKKWIEGDEHE